MSRINRIILLFVLMTSVIGNSYGQIFPVSITSQAVPPHTGNIADWTAPGSNRLNVNILLQDANEVNFQARLKVEIKGQGITLRSRNETTFSPISLRYGAPTILSGIDLSGVLHYENLIFENYSIAQYEANGGLPDGMYQICFEVFDYDRVEEKPASLPSCVSIFASLHKTPVVLSPIGEVNPLYPQFLPIQWQARHNASFPTEYHVEIYEFDPSAGMTPDLIVEFDQPFISKTVMAMTSTIADVSDPQLIPGRQYIIRVQAEDISKQNGFKNNGWSDFEIFTYGNDVCPAPFNVRADYVDESSARILWDPVPGAIASSYMVKYRNKTIDNSQWYEDETALNEWRLEGLKENTRYEYQLSSKCQSGQTGTFSELQTFVTTASEILEDCGAPSNRPTIENQNPANSINEDAIITISGFKIYLNSITQSPGGWSGNGAVHIPWISDFININFENISINTDLEVFAGKIVGITNGLDAFEGFPNAAELTAERNAPDLDLCGISNTFLPSENNTPETTTNENNIVIGGGINSRNLPYGLTQYSANKDYVIALSEMEITPDGGSLKAHMSLETPVGGAEIRHLIFSGLADFHTGGLTDSGKLFLEEEVQSQLQANTRFNFKKGENSYVAWDCKGFQAVNLSGSVDFCRDLILPFDTSNGADYVTGTFETNMNNWGDFVCNISMPPFAIPHQPDWKWEAQNMLFDYSDTSTPTLINYPEDYVHPDVMSGMAAEDVPSWTGFYLPTASIVLPNNLTGKAVGSEVTIAAENVIIDDAGLSAWVYEDDLMDLETGRMGSWEMSMDSLSLEIQSSYLSTLEFAGEVHIPAFEEVFSYDASIDAQSKFFFDIEWPDTLFMSAFHSKLALKESSTIAIEYDEIDEKYMAQAMLHGMADFTPKTPGGTKLTIPGVDFENFELLSNDPYVNLGNWELEGKSGPSLGANGLTIKEFVLIQDELSREIIIGIAAKVQLTKAGGGSLMAEGVIQIIGDVQYSEEHKRQVWSHKKVQVDKFAIDASSTGYAFKGSLEFFEKHPIYGSGFRGAVEATFEPKISVGAVAQFGNIDNYDYFFADALATYNPGITIGTSGLMLYGFGGGASYHMERSGFRNITMPAEGKNPSPSAPSGVGVALSGMRYLPNKDVGVGIKATVALGTVNRTLFNGNATLEFIFNNSGGLHQIGFDGKGKFLTEPESSPKLSCNLGMTYDFPAKAFHASLDVFVNIENQIVGAYENKFAGNGTLHIDPHDWYLYIGTPDAPMSLKLSTELIPNLDPLSISMGGYFDAGTILPPFPGLPATVTSILGEYSVTSRDDPRFAGGNGLIFGSSFEAKLADLRYAMFFASFGAGAGWDMMLYDYGAAARCAGNENSPNPIGIDGWYGSGQMYAYLQGKVGIHVDLFLVKGDFTILEIGAAAALQARLPNPMYMKGKVGGYYNILGGAVSGSCSFQFEAGELCEVVGKDALGIEIISDISPNANENSEVDVFIRPEVAFTFKMGEAFSLLDEDQVQHFYKAMLDDFSIIRTDDGSNVPGEIVWSDDYGVMGFKTENIFDPQTEYKLAVTVRVDTKKWDTEWKTLTDDFGAKYTQTKEVTFTTGDAPNYIPLNNIAYSYPVNTQFNYLKDQSNTGYIQLIQGQDYMFDGSMDGEWVRKMRLIQNGLVLQQFDLDYDAAKNRISFPLPAEKLANSTITQLVMVAVPTGSPAAVDANMVMKETTLVFNQSGEAGEAAGADEDFTSILIKQRALENQSQNSNEEVMLATNFRTSRYNTLQEKIAALAVIREWKNFTYLDATIAEDGSQSGLGIDGFGIDWSGPELFDKFEMHGYFNPVGEFIHPLLDLEADLSNTGITAGKEWYDNEIFVNMSQYLPNAEIPVRWRDASIYGNIPSKALPLKQWTPYEAKVLTEQEVRDNSASFSPLKTRMYFKVPYYLVKDYFQFRNDVANYYASRTLPESMNNFLTWSYKGPYSGDYKFNIKYKKPGEAAQGNIQKSIHYPGYD